MRVGGLLLAAVDRELLDLYQEHRASGASPRPSPKPSSASPPLKSLTADPSAPRTWRKAILYCFSSCPNRETMCAGACWATSAAREPRRSGGAAGVYGKGWMSGVG